MLDTFKKTWIYEIHIEIFFVSSTDSVSLTHFLYHLSIAAHGDGGANFSWLLTQGRVHSGQEPIYHRANTKANHPITLTFTPKSCKDSPKIVIIVLIKIMKIWIENKYFISTFNYCIENCVALDLVEQSKI